MGLLTGGIGISLTFQPSFGTLFLLLDCLILLYFVVFSLTVIFGGLLFSEGQTEGD